MHPFLDVTKLSDEEILQRIGKAYSHMNFQVQVGHSATVSSIKEIIQALEDERHTRLQRTMASETEKKFPDLSKPISLGTLEK